MFSYHKLRKDLPQEAGEEEEATGTAAPTAVPSRRRGWLKLRASGSRRRWWWRRRPRVRIPTLRTKVRVVRRAVAKVVKRFKEGRAHLGDLFAGNYMFMQVNPSPPPMVCQKGKHFMPPSYGHATLNYSIPHSRYPLPYVAS